MIYGCLEQILVFLPLALGLFISYQILQITDLTVDGSFVLAPVVYARLLAADLPLMLALAIAIMTAGACGIASAILQRHQRVSPLLAGILVSYCLLSLNLLILGRPNQGLSDYPHLSDTFSSPLIAYSAISFMAYAAFFILLQSHLGTCLRAFGCNRNLLRAMSCHEERYRIIGLFLCNAFAGLSGCLTADLNDYVDCRMGQGLCLIAIGTVVIGLQLLPKKQFNPIAQLNLASFSVLIGVAAYFTLSMLLMYLGLDPFYLKLTLGLTLAVFMYSSSKPENLGRLAL